MLSLLFLLLLSLFSFAVFLPLKALLHSSQSYLEKYFFKNIFPFYHSLYPPLAPFLFLICDLLRWESWVGFESFVCPDINISRNTFYLSTTLVGALMWWGWHRAFCAYSIQHLFSPISFSPTQMFFLGTYCFVFKYLAILVFFLLSISSWILLCSENMLCVLLVFYWFIKTHFK